MNAATHVYRLRGAEGPWGDYSSILIHGMAGPVPYPDGPLHLDRTGPFAPPITFPGLGAVVVTDRFKDDLTRSGLTGLSFRPVVKERIVHLRWEEWDQSLAEPPRYPAGSEPENYVLGRKHSEKASQAVGDLWELLLEAHADDVSIERGESLLSPSRFTIHSWDGTDFFRDGPPVFVSEAAKAWLGETVPEWVRFEPVQTI